jgi:hypothetical protein
MVIDAVVGMVMDTVMDMIDGGCGGLRTAMCRVVYPLGLSIQESYTAQRLCILVPDWHISKM